MAEQAITRDDGSKEEVEEEEDGEEEEEDPVKAMETLNLSGLRRKEKRKAAKKLKRKQTRRETALKAREVEEARLNDEEEQRRNMLKEQEEAEIMERQRKEFEERERLWMERAAKKAEEEAQKRLLEVESREKQSNSEDELNEADDWDYVEEGPAEIIWQGNEIIVKKKSVRVPKRSADQQSHNKDADRPTSNPLPPQSEAFASYKNRSSGSSLEVFESVAQQTPNFGTEQDKAHCPFHIKTGACRFGSRCSRVHFYPDKSCTLLIKNMYTGPGLSWDQDEGLEYTDEEVERCYEEFYEDVHTEFLKFGEIVNFKVCKNGSFHLRGNLYVHYKSLESAILAYHSINGRYFAGKQITCEYVGVTRWKVAICGEYMKSRLKICSHGTACNFIHCFRNPGGDYEWADWDNPPPKYWVKKMAALFGPSDESTYEKRMAHEVQPRNSSRKTTQSYGRYHSRRSRSRDVGYWDSSSGGDSSDENRKVSDSQSSRRKHLGRYHSRRSRSRDVDYWVSSTSGDSSDENRKGSGSHSSRQKHSGIGRKMKIYIDGNGQQKENSNFESNRYKGNSITHDYDSSNSSGKDQSRWSRLSRRNAQLHKKGELFPSDENTITDKNGYLEYDQCEGKEVRIRDSTRRHSKSKDHSSRREGLTRRTKKEIFVNENVVSVKNYESEKSRNGHDHRSISQNMNSGLNFRENVDQCDRWEAGTTLSSENEKYGYFNDDNDEPYEERCDRNSTKIRTRCWSRSSQRTQSNSLEEDRDSSDEDIHSKEIHDCHHGEKRSHDHRKKKKIATSETLSPEDSKEILNYEYEHRSGSHSRKHRSSSRRAKHENDYEKVKDEETSDLGAENLHPKGTSGKRSRSRSPAQRSRRSKRDRHHDCHES